MRPTAATARRRSGSLSDGNAGEALPVNGDHGARRRPALKEKCPSASVRVVVEPSEFTNLAFPISTACSLQRATCAPAAALPSGSSTMPSIASSGACLFNSKSQVLLMAPASSGSEVADS